MGQILKCMNININIDLLYVLLVIMLEIILD